MRLLQSPGAAHHTPGKKVYLVVWAQFALALGFVRVLGLSAGARKSLAAYHRPLGLGITVAGLTTVLARPAKSS